MLQHDNSRVEVEIGVRRGNHGLGVVVSPNNFILELAAGGAAEEDARLLVGDLVVGIDG